MKKIKLVVWAATLSCFLFSCSHGLLKDPRLYNSKKNAGSDAIAVAPEPELGLTGGVDAFDNLDKWYNKPNSNGDGTNPGKEGFPHTDFDTMSLVGTYFDGSNVPVYAMKYGDVWVAKDGAKAEYVHANAPDTTGQGYTISNVHWYQYRGRNPVYAADGNYNNALQVTDKGNPKLQRFYFYRFTGDTLSPSLDNFLFAVDTYSKLMFAFAKPTATKSVFGNNVPTAWGPTDGEAFLGTNYQFYMYDPVGYVEKKDDGSYGVTLYQWFSGNLAKGLYQPTLGGLDSNSQGTPLTEEARKDPNGAGKSPFNNHESDYFVDNIKLLAGNAYTRRPSEGEHTNGSWLYTVSAGKDGTEFVESKEQYGTNKEENGRKFTHKSSATATTGVFSDGSNDWEVSLEDRASKISFRKTDGSEEFTVSLGQDPGPAWLLRVKDKIFSGSGYTYTFSADGKTIELDNGKTYTYVSQDANDRAVYQAGFAVYWGVMISEHDTKIAWTPTSWASAGTTPTSLATSSPAWLSVPIPENPKFYDYVKGGVYSYREADGYTGTDGKGYGVTLHSWTFDATGKNATQSTTVWRKAKSDSSSSNSYSSETDATTAVYGGKTFTLGDDGHTLTVDGVKYYRNFYDLGPSFRNRVKDNPKFGLDGETQYEFQGGGDSLTCDGSSYTFERVEDDRSRAVYWYYSWGSYKFYGVELSNDDTTIKMTRWSAKNAIQWYTLGWAATRTSP